MRHKNPIPFAACYFGGKELSPVAGQVIFRGDKQLHIGINLLEFSGELLKEMVGEDVHWLLDEPCLLKLHSCGCHAGGLAGPNHVCQECVAATHATPNRVLLMLAEFEHL